MHSFRFIAHKGSLFTTWIFFEWMHSFHFAPHLQLKQKLLQLKQEVQKLLSSFPFCQRALAINLILQLLHPTQHQSYNQNMMWWKWILWKEMKNLLFAAVALLWEDNGALRCEASQSVFHGSDQLIIPLHHPIVINALFNINLKKKVNFYIHI